MKRSILLTLFVCLIFSSAAFADLVAYYPFNGNANDESGNLNHGTVHGATLSTDRFGDTDKAYYFDGSSYIELTVIELPDTYTICTWINPDNLDGQQNIVNKDQWYSETVRSYYVEFDQGGRLVNAVTSSSGFTQYRTNNIVLSAGDWKFVAMTYDGNADPGNKMKFYVNGALVPAYIIAGQDSGGTPNTGPLTTKIGVNGDVGDNNHFFGLIDDVRIYNQVLTENEIKDLYDSEKPPEPDPCADQVAAAYEEGYDDGYEEGYAIGHVNGYLEGLMVDEVTICHKPGKNQKTMTIPRSALNSHLNHGDTIGECN